MRRELSSRVFPKQAVARTAAKATEGFGQVDAEPQGVAATAGPRGDAFLPLLAAHGGDGLAVGGAFFAASQAARRERGGGVAASARAGRGGGGVKYSFLPMTGFRSGPKNVFLPDSRFRKWQKNVFWPETRFRIGLKKVFLLAMRFRI